MFSLLSWLKSAEWYYLLAIAVGGLIVIAIIIRIIVALVRRSKRSNRTYSARGRVTELQSVVVPRVSTKKVTTIAPPPLTIIPSAPPLELEHYNYYYNPNNTNSYNSQGQMVRIPFAPIPSSETTRGSAVNTNNTVSLKKKENVQRPQKPIPSIPLEKSKRVNSSSTVTEQKTEVLARDQPALSNYSKKQMKKELELAEAQELQLSLGQEISLEEYNSVEEEEDSSQIWIEERNGASNNQPQNKEKKIVPSEVHHYNVLHIKAAIRIQRCYRKFIRNLEKEISALFREQSRMITLNKNKKSMMKC